MVTIELELKSLVGAAIVVVIDKFNKFSHLLSLSNKIRMIYSNYTHGIDQRLPVDGIGNQVRDGRQQAHLAFIQAGRRIDAKYPQRLVVGNQVEG